MADIIKKTTTTTEETTKINPANINVEVEQSSSGQQSGGSAIKGGSAPAQDVSGGPMASPSGSSQKSGGSSGSSGGSSGGGSNGLSKGSPKPVKPYSNGGGQAGGGGSSTGGSSSDGSNGQVESETPKKEGDEENPEEEKEGDKEKEDEESKEDAEKEGEEGEKEEGDVDAEKEAAEGAAAGGAGEGAEAAGAGKDNIDHNANNQERAEQIAKDSKNKPVLDQSSKDKAKDAEGKKGLLGQYSDLRNKYSVDGVKNAGQKAAKEMAKKAAEVALNALKVAAQAALDALVGFFGWPVLIVCLVIFLVLILIFAGLACSAAGGNFGKSNPIISGKNDPNIQLLTKKSIAPTKSISGTVIKGQTALSLTDADKKFLEDGKADKRLLALLNYLSDKHSQLTISSLVGGFTDPNSKDSENIDEGTSNGASAHAEGMAADIKTADFVYKVDRPSEMCQHLVASICGPAEPVCFNIAKMLKIGNLAYYSDKNIPESATTTAPNISLDSTLDQSKFDTQKIVLENVQQTITEAQGQYTDFTSKLTQSKDVLVNFRSQNLSRLTGDQRNQLNTQIDKVQTALNQVNDISGQINGYKDQINDYQTKIDSLQNNLNSVKSNLAKVQKFNNALGANKDAGLDSTINSIASIANQVVSSLDTVDSQLSTINTVLTQTTSTINPQVQGAQSVIGQNQGDMNAYLSNLNSLNITIDAGNVPLLFNVFANGKQALDGFIQKIEQLAQAFINKTVEQIVNEIKTQIKEQVQQVIDDQINQVLSGLGLSGFDKNTLLLLPCVGYVVPGTSSLTSAIGVDGAISNFTNSQLVTDINSGIDSAVGTINTANDQLTQVTQSISGVQNTITSFTDQITQMENKAKQFINNINDTALDEMNQAISTVQSTSNQNLDSLLKTPTDGQAGDQVCKSSTSYRDPKCTSNINDQQQSQQQTQAQNQTNILQSKTDLLNVKTRLQTVKTNLQNTLEQQGNKLSQTQQAAIQKQIQSIQNTIGQVDTWVAKIDAYKAQMDAINNKILTAQNTLTSISDSLLGVQNFVNNISGNISGWVTKLIPSGFRAYGVLPNTKYKDQQYTEAVQIQIKWQDDPPDSKYTNSEKDNKGILNSLIFYTVYRPEAQRKVHDLITEILQFPYDMKDITTYKVTQLITFSKERDVTPFATTVDKLYGKSRPANYGLFNMKEFWAKLHIGY